MGLTTDLQHELLRLSEGCLDSRRTIIDLCCQRLRVMARRMLKSYGHIQRWSDTDDVLQNSLLRLHRALATVQPESVRKFYGLASTQIRRELIDLARSHFGPQGIGTKHDSDAGKASEQVADDFEPESLEEWTAFHEAVEGLPDAEREAFSLTFYDGLNQTEAARVVGCSLATLKRRLLSARLLLQEQLRGGDHD
ncbi:RNA polymerase sigma factor [Rubinisphaera brasiliensis]|uniref:RNA polymerase, sigma-24 subunit, ECF subfamily n=1 Tax=Rubinisphaera brasiliensis (strain ATCC 49424 / DSM 5305 / JCM 21570 / IAM 15109 / NBRC 103401 / IFAM 1448) TaxID=756272 RepID=F0SLP7_RUBBR|nr:sigma-70 family RNA polymerase sigma factor [Rubinisphaera brasiliensis]ADY58788.1 RNA polymerase, sigma-24 subunit, ECF subfamily [Rubinisphaera brasiliensis DSM 5305]